MEEYYFVYCNSMGKWGEAKNPAFIAKHKKCRAIFKVYDVKKVIEELNNYDFSNDIYDMYLDNTLDEILSKLMNKKEN